MAPRVIEYACAWWPYLCVAMHDICLSYYTYDCLIVIWLLSDHDDYDPELVSDGESCSDDDDSI